MESHTFGKKSFSYFLPNVGVFPRPLQLTPCVIFLLKGGYGKVVQGLLNLPDVNVAWRKFAAIDFRHAATTTKKKYIIITAARSARRPLMSRGHSTQNGFFFPPFSRACFSFLVRAVAWRERETVVGNGRSSFVVSSSQHVLSPS